MKTIVAIPTRYAPETLADLLFALASEGAQDQVWILNNSHDDTSWLPEAPGRHVFDLPNRTIYEMWNFAWRHALDLAYQGDPAIGDADENGPIVEPFNLCFLNDDIKVLSGFPFIGAMAHWLRSAPQVAAVCPDYNRPLSEGYEATSAPKRAQGSFKDGGLSGWAFMFKGEWHVERDLPFVDEQFEWWCGDDDLFAQLNRRGVCLRLDGLPLEHVGELSARERPELELAKGRDIERFKNKYGRW